MVLFHDKASSWCRHGGHNFKECRKHINRETMRTAAQEMQLPQPVGNTRLQKRCKQTPHVAMSEALDPNRIYVKVNGDPALVISDLLFNSPLTNFSSVLGFLLLATVYNVMYSWNNGDSVSVYWTLTVPSNPCGATWYRPAI